ncbi:MAG: ParA family protein [Clostridia bacterium]|nr:ParA family protein [Clostridia bacterium]
MATTIAIANQKGGVAKSTTATALAYALHQKEARVLFVDADPQCNTTKTFGVTAPPATLCDIFLHQCTTADAVCQTAYGDVIAGDHRLGNADRLLNEIGKEFIMSKALKEVASNYDYIVIDTPPSLGVMLVNAATAADKVIITVPAEEYAVEGLDLLVVTIAQVKEYTNPAVELAGMLLTRCNPRTKLFDELRAETAAFAARHGTSLFNTYIRECNAVKTAQRQRKFLMQAAPASTAAQDYRAFAEELIGGI